MRFVILFALMLAACSQKAEAPATDAVSSDISLPSDATPAAQDATPSSK